MNQAIIIGNMTRDPELKKTNAGDDVASFGVATNKRWKNKDGEKQEKVEFHNCVAWGKLAEIIATFGSKGMKVMVQGELQTRNWEDDNGVKHYRTEIRASEFEMLSPKDPSKQEREIESEGPEATADDLLFD